MYGTAFELPREKTRADRKPAAMTTRFRNPKEADIVRPCNANIQKTLELVQDMIALADKGDLEREDVGCGIMYGIMRDAAYRLKQIAEKEKQAHILKGWWNASC